MLHAATQTAHAELLYTESCEVIVKNITMFEDCFCTVTPCTTTGSGSDDCAILTLFCTCTVAISMSVPTANVIVREYAPEDEELEDI